MVEGLLAVKSSKWICKGCIVDKHPENKFDQGKEGIATCILGLSHSDISGPIPTTSMNGLRYVLAVIDYLSIFTWVYFLKKKSKVFKISKILKLPLRLLIGARSNISDLIMEVNKLNHIFCNFVWKMGSISSTLFPTHLSRMM